MGYAISLVAAALLLVFLSRLLLARRRAREAAPAATAPDAGALAPDAAPARMSLPRAAAIALAAHHPARDPVRAAHRPWRSSRCSRSSSGAARAGAPADARGAPRLLGVVVPILYAVISPRNRGGYNFEYSIELIWAHWVRVVALVLLMVVCWRSLAAARGRR